MKVDKPLLRGHFHQAMFFISLGACLLLVAKSRTSQEWIATSIYSFGVLTMFGISTLYHRINWSSNARLKMKRLDHAGIYLMIAGTFTPIALLTLEEPSRTHLLASIWGVALIGILQSIFFVNLPKMISAILYLIAGYLILPYLSELKPALGTWNVGLLVAGGIVYSIGALTYGLKRPMLNPRIFSYHEVFHVLVSIGAILHFCVIYSILSRN